MVILYLSHQSDNMTRTISLLDCAHRLGGPKLKRFVLLGSAVAILNSFEDLSLAGRDYTEDDWNPVQYNISIRQY